MKRKILILLLFQIVFNSYSYDWNIHSYIDSKMKELDARKEQLDPRGIFVGDMIDFIDPITILSSDSIGYNPHTQRLSYTDYNNLKIWVKIIWKECRPPCTLKPITLTSIQQGVYCFQVFLSMRIM